MKNNPFRLLRLLFVIASLSPLVILWSVRGIAFVPDNYLWIAIAILVIIPNAVIYLRWQIVRSENISSQVEVVEATDNSEHLVIYLLAVFLALYSASIDSLRDLIALMLTFILVVTLFWFANLHYLNLLFAVRGYKTFTISIKVNDGSRQHKKKAVLLTRRDSIEIGEQLNCYQLSHDVLIDKEA